MQLNRIKSLHHYGNQRCYYYYYYYYYYAVTGVWCRIVLQGVDTTSCRPNCFELTTPDGSTYYLSIETREELLQLEKAWHKATYIAVKHLAVSMPAEHVSGAAKFCRSLLSSIYGSPAHRAVPAPTTSRVV